MANVPGAQAEFIERDGSGLSVMVMRLMRRAMVETGFAEAMRLTTPAVQVLEPVQRLRRRFPAVCRSMRIVCARRSSKLSRCNHSAVEDSAELIAISPEGYLGRSGSF